MKDITPKNKSSKQTETIDVTDDNINKLVHILYGLMAGGFFFIITPIIAIMLAYIKREDVEGTIYESHFTWIIRTFWLSLIGFVVTMPFIFFLKITIILAPIGALLFGMVVLWYIYNGGIMLHI